MDAYGKFRNLLDDSYDWPSAYTFKFIVPAMQESEVRLQLPKGEVTTTMSSTQKYVSVTCLAWMNSSDEVIAIYEKMKTIKGLIAL